MQINNEITLTLKSLPTSDHTYTKIASSDDLTKTSLESKKKSSKDTKSTKKSSKDTHSACENQKNKKQSIPKTLKIDVWNKYIGEDTGKTKCLCCKSKDITQLNFHCGHVLAENNGGRLNVDNLRPICASCNLSMGSTHMDEFIKKCGYDKPILKRKRHPIFSLFSFGNKQNNHQKNSGGDK